MIKVSGSRGGGGGGGARIKIIKEKCAMGIFIFFFLPPPPPPQRDDQRQTEGADTNQEPHDANLVSSAHETLHDRYSMPTIKINKVTNKPYKYLQIHIIGDLVHIETVIS